MSDLRLMAVHAHPDDESSKGAATLAKYAAEGVQVLVVTCTGGERGSILNPHYSLCHHPPGVLADVRRREMAEAARIIGVEHEWLGFVDSGMTGSPADCFARVDLMTGVEALVRVIRRFQPGVIITYGENGGYPHPDHVMTHRITVAAFDAASDWMRFRHVGIPWQPLKLYYDRSFSQARKHAEDAAMAARRLTRRHSAWVEDYGPLGDEYTTQVDCADWFETRDRALQAHATQVDPGGEWFSVPLRIRQEAWPTEEFTLARSLVPVSLPERDLFAGIRTSVSLSDDDEAGQVSRPGFRPVQRSRFGR